MNMEKSSAIAYAPIIGILAMVMIVAVTAILQISSLRATGMAGQEKVVICHIPPGNPANAHTIIVGKPAIPAHLAHGDTLGACERSCQNPNGSGGCCDQYDSDQQFADKCNTDPAFWSQNADCQCGGI